MRFPFSGYVCLEQVARSYDTIPWMPATRRGVSTYVLDKRQTRMCSEARGGISTEHRGCSYYSIEVSNMAVR